MTKITIDVGCRQDLDSAVEWLMMGPEAQEPGKPVQYVRDDTGDGMRIVIRLGIFAGLLSPTDTLAQFEQVCNLLLEQTYTIAITELEFYGSVGDDLEGAVDDFVEVFAEALKRNDNNISKLSYLELSHMGIGDRGVIALANALLKQSSNINALTNLNLQGNDFGEHGSRALADVLLQSECSITELDLSLNPLEDEGGSIIALALQHNTSLTRLELSHTMFEVDAIYALLRALLHNATLKRLGLDGNRTNIHLGGQQVGCDFRKALQVNQTLIFLDLDGMHLGDENGVILAEGLKHNTTLKELLLSNNDLGIATAATLTESLKHNSSLTILELSGGNRMPEPVRDALELFVALNKPIVRNDISDALSYQPSGNCKDHLLFLLMVLNRIDSTIMVGSEMGPDIWWQVLGMLKANDLIRMSNTTTIE